MRFLTDSSWRGWLACAGSAVLLAVAANAYIFAVGTPTETSSGGTIAVTGPVGQVIATIVPFVWLFLYAGLGTAFWFVARGRPRIPAMAWAIIALLANCVAYPAYTDNLRDNDVALAGNVLTIGLAALAIGLVLPRSRAAAALIFPVIAWVSIASVGLVALMTSRTF